MNRRRKILKILAGVTTALLLGLLVLWLFPNQVLTVDSGPVTADAIVVLGGGVTDRPRRAVESFQAGEAPLIVCSGLGDCQSNRRLLEKAGVPRSATWITFMLGSRNNETAWSSRISIFSAAMEVPQY